MSASWAGLWVVVLVEGLAEVIVEVLVVVPIEVLEEVLEEVLVKVLVEVSAIQKASLGVLGEIVVLLEKPWKCWNCNIVVQEMIEVPNWDC